MGLQPLEVKDWIQIGPDYPQQMAAKRQLLQQNYNEVVASLPGSQSAQQEVLDLLVEHLLQHFPEHFQGAVQEEVQGEVQGDAQGQGASSGGAPDADRLTNRTITNHLTEESWNPSDFTENPLDLAGRLVQEDLCLMLPGTSGYELVAASLCFPSRWRLRDKLGQPLAHIHHPVPGYHTQLEHPVDNFFQRLKPDFPGWRSNWSIHPTPDLFLPPDEDVSDLISAVTPENAGDRLWLRTERQTLRRLPISSGILFTIRTRIHPLSGLANYAEAAKNLIHLIQTMPAEMQQYKHIQPMRSALLAYLATLL